jgi:transcriptional regulator with XRE-family HTH domain
MAKRKRGSTTDAIDCHVGSRIRERRITLGLTRRQLGEMTGLRVPVERDHGFRWKMITQSGGT